jgi:transcriptional regulator GlxA family with amidase domain
VHTVAVLAFEGVVAFDLAVPVETFGYTRLDDGSPPYRVLVCAPSPSVSTGLFEIRAPHGLEALRQADTIMVPGVAEGFALPGEDVYEALRAAMARGARIASVCSGALVLAAAGLLDGQRATTHWLAGDVLARRHPKVDVTPDVLFVDNGAVLTSAGAAAGLDLCLHMIRNDFGATVAADAARRSVMQLERAGGQAQFITHEPPGPEAGASLQPLLHWLAANGHRELTLTDLAARAALSPRSLTRKFREQTGTTPLQWLARARVRRAQELLETTDRPVEQLAFDVGFTSLTSFRDRFRRVVGTTPQAYRRAFRSRA